MSRVCTNTFDALPIWPVSGAGGSTSTSFWSRPPRSMFDSPWPVVARGAALKAAGLPATPAGLLWLDCRSWQGAGWGGGGL
jgi:hypothetical protein